jgi:hypothetical protein
MLKRNSMEEFIEIGSHGRPMYECHSCGEVFEEGNVCCCEPTNRRWYFIFKDMVSLQDTKE